MFAELRCGQILRLVALGIASLGALSDPTRAAMSEVPLVGAIQHTYIDTPIRQTQNAWSTTLETINGDQVVSRATFSAPFGDPQVQQAISEAAAILTADGAASIDGPVLLSNFTTQSSDLSYVLTGHSAMATRTVGSPIPIQGPKTIQVDLNYSSAMSDFDYQVSPQPLFISGGQEFLSAPTTFNWTVYRNAVTTDTLLTSQTYAITGTAQPTGSSQAPSVALPSAATSGLATLGCIAVMLVVRKPSFAAPRPRGLLR